MFAYIIFVILLTSANAYKLSAPDVSYCIDGTDAYFDNIIFEIKPFPIHIQSGAPLSIEMGFDILQSLEVGSKLRYEFSIHTFLGNIPLPCIPVSISNLLILRIHIFSIFFSQKTLIKVL